MKLLLISNSTMPGENYLQYPLQQLKEFLGENPVEALFIPFAAVTFSFDEYEQKVNKSLNQIGHSVKGIHHFADPVKAVNEAKAIIIGGGNTWQLVRMLHDQNLIEPIQKKVASGTPYAGWSAGSNVACPTLCTTNDMPIMDPKGFDTLNLVPFQINPHYTDLNPAGHGGETRQQRIEEYLVANQSTHVLGLREGTMLKINDKKIHLIGIRPARLFKYGNSPKEYEAGSDLSFLLNNK